MKKNSFFPQFNMGDIYSKIVILISIAFALAFRHYIFAIALGIALLFSFLFSGQAYRRSVRKMRAYMEGAAVHVGASESMPGFPFPAVSVTESGKIIWYNSAMDKLVEGELLFQKDIQEYVKDFKSSSEEGTEFYTPYKAVINDISFIVYAHKTPPQEDGKELILMYFIDVSRQEELEEQYTKNRLAALAVAFDNFEEVMQGAEDDVRNAVQSAVERSLASMAGEVGGILKKTERDRFFMLINAEALQMLMAKKFAILDTVREINVGNTIAPTLSIGIGFEGQSFQENEVFARNALDMALGRGGDQVVIKDSQTMQYFGGKTREVEKRTKVKARVVAYALRELICQSNNIIIVGHKNADVDCIGAAMGIVAIARHLEKKAYILQYDYDDTASAVVKKALEDPSYQDVFLRRANIEDVLTVKSLVLIVDTNSPSYMEGEDLLGTTEHLVLIDHHRRSSDFIKNPTLAYHEPYASSTCEMITEMLPYLNEKNILNKVEAEALYAGIYLDTKSFTFKTGVRTLEAAAFLRRAGIDPVSVKQFFKNNLQTFTMKASLIQGAKLLQDHIAISVTEELRSPFIIAQAADELLNISGIDTSFVIARSETGCILSGRSTGDINVQLVLEKLGGGGHFAVAGAQIKDVTPKEAEGFLTKAIEEYLTER